MQNSTNINSVNNAHMFEGIALDVLRYGLSFVIAWIGMMKFTHYEAVGIQPLIARSPLMSWMLHVWSPQGVSSIVGTVELLIVVLILLRRWSPKACMVGSAMGCIMFLTSLSFLFSTPGWEPSLGGFPALSIGIGEFIIKDIVLFGAAFLSFAEANSANSVSSGKSHPESA